jgi:hypothetical protein
MFCRFCKGLKTKMIAISEENHHKLAQLGNLEDSFDSVISRLLKEAMSGRTLGGSSQSTAAPPQPGGNNG